LPTFNEWCNSVQYFCSVYIIPKAVRTNNKNVTMLYIMGIYLSFFWIITVCANLVREIETMLLFFWFVNNAQRTIFLCFVFPENHVSGVS
jgi:hypothetical protein